MNNQQTPMLHSECGCRLGVTDGDFIIEPCSDTCWIYLCVIEESAKVDLPLNFMTLC